MTRGARLPKPPVVTVVLALLLSAFPLGVGETLGAEDPGELLVEQLIAENDLGHAVVGVAVEDLETGESLLSYNAEKYFTPASNQKLLTSWAALNELGPDYRYRTQCYVEAGSELGGGRVDSDLLVKGNGSPEFRPSRLAEGLSSELGGREVTFTEDLVIDVSEFDGTYHGPGWMWDDENDYIGPLSVPLLSEILSSPTDREEYAKGIGGLIRSSLNSNGITVEGEVVGGEVERDWERIHATRSLPLTRLLEEMNRYSDNFTADTVFKSLSDSKGEASFELSGELVKKQLKEAGVEGQLRVADGSGLSRYNLIRPSQLVELLSYGFEHPRLEEKGPERFGQLRRSYLDGENVFTSTLPRWGTGTMSSREGDLEVRAKTGTLRDTSTLSGYLLTEESSLLAFSIMINRTMDVGSGRSLQTDLLEYLRDRR